MANVLVVDDDDNLRKIIQIFLEADGHDVYEAADGVIALRFLQEGPVDVVITDIFMPHQDGIGTIMEIREKYPSIRIIAISGGGRRADIDFLELAEYVGASNIFKKPFEMQALREKVQELLR